MLQFKCGKVLHNYNLYHLYVNLLTTDQDIYIPFTEIKVTEDAYIYILFVPLFKKNFQIDFQKFQQLNNANRRLREMFVPKHL